MHAWQSAGRGSTAFHTVLYFKENPATEDAYVLRILESKVVVLVPRFGIEVSWRHVRCFWGEDLHPDKARAPLLLCQSTNQSINQSPSFHPPTLRQPIASPFPSHMHEPSLSSPPHGTNYILYLNHILGHDRPAGAGGPGPAETGPGGAQAHGAR